MASSSDSDGESAKQSGKKDGKSGDAAEDIHIEYKACALASQIMKDNLAKTVTAFLNSQDGGCFLIGIEEDAEKKPVLSGLEKTEIILDETKNRQAIKHFTI